MTDRSSTTAAPNNSILNNRYQELIKHYAKVADGSLNYLHIRKGKEQQYFSEAIVKCHLPDGQGVNVVLEISEMTKRKTTCASA